MGDVVLYLLGAGASRQALPLASDFSEHLRIFAHDLEQAGPRDKVYLEPLSVPDDPVWGRPRLQLRDAIRWLAEEASHHSSVDTFARALFPQRLAESEEVESHPLGLFNRRAGAEKC